LNAKIIEILLIIAAIHWQRFEDLILKKMDKGELALEPGIF